MADMMTFPETWEEFEKSYGFDDSEEVYTNGSRLIPSFRVKQWLDHIAQPERKIELHGDESAIEILSELRSWFSCFDEKEGFVYNALSLAIRGINESKRVN